MGKALSIMQLMNKHETTVKFTGHWQKLIGNPSLKGSWIIWGQSANGKTRFTVQLMKYLATFAKVAYNSMEEGSGATIKRAFEGENMQDVNGKVLIIDNEGFDEMVERLAKKKSPRIMVIDSVQYLGITYAQYKRLKAMFPGKLFVWVSHAAGLLPEGRVANKIRYDAHVKMHVQGFVATAQSRYGDSSEPYVIWEKGAEMYGKVES